MGSTAFFFDRIVGSDPLAWIDRTHAILVGTLLITFSISLFAVAWTGYPITAMSIDSTAVRKLFAYAYCVAVGSFVFGLFLVRTIEHFDIRYVTGMVLCGAFLICVLFWTHREVRRSAISETAGKHADQFLWSCIFFSMLSLSFGIAVTALILYSADFTRTFGAVWFGALTCVGIYPVLRDTKRLADAVGPDQITSR
jgi:high-affinity Fe2+/Pb2+ permease